MKAVLRQWTLRLLASMALIGFAATAGILGFWLADRDIPTRFQRTRTVVHEASPGGVLQIRIPLVRDRLCHTTINRRLVDARGEAFDLGITVYPHGTGPKGEDLFRSEIQIPAGMALGPATYTASACYRCNPVHWLWPVCDVQRTTSFIVTARKE